MFGRVTHTLEAAVMQLRSLFTSFTFCNIIISCSVIPKYNIGCSITCVLLIEILATINLYYIVSKSTYRNKFTNYSGDPNTMFSIQMV